MPITSEDLIAPYGELEYALFPSLTEVEVLGRLDVYLAEGYTKAADTDADPDYMDEAARHWAYHKAFFNVYLSMSIKPTQMLLTDQGSQQYNPGQAKRFLDLSELNKEAFNALVGAPINGNQRSASSSAKNIYKW